MWKEREKKRREERRTKKSKERTPGVRYLGKAGQGPIPCPGIAAFLRRPQTTQRAAQTRAGAAAISQVGPPSLNVVSPFSAVWSVVRVLCSALPSQPATFLVVCFPLVSLHCTVLACRVLSCALRSRSFVASTCATCLTSIIDDHRAGYLRFNTASIHFDPYFLPLSTESLILLFF